MSQYQKIMKYAEKRKTLLSQTLGVLDKMFQERSSCRIGINHLEETIPKLEQQLAHMKKELPVQKERLKVIEKSFDSFEDLRVLQEEKLKKADRRVTLMLRLKQLNKEISRM